MFGHVPIFCFALRVFRAVRRYGAEMINGQGPMDDGRSTRETESLASWCVVPVAPARHWRALTKIGRRQASLGHRPLVIPDPQLPETPEEPSLQP